MNLSTHKIRAISSIPRRALHVAFYFFLVTGVFVVSYAGFMVASSRVFQNAEIKKFHQAGPQPKPHVLVEGEVLGEIDVPRVGIRAIVVHGDSPAQLRNAVGHVSKSALPGEGGNVVLAGHRDTFFRALRNIQVGDEVRFMNREREFTYRVESIEIVRPTDLRVLESTNGHDLTLLTCFPFRYVGPAP